MIATFMAFFLIAIVLLAMFNSFYHAVLILVAVVLAMIGALLGHAGDGRNLQHHHVGHRHAGAGRHRGEPQHRADRYLPPPASPAGMDPIEAIVRSSAQRLRPVFLTTVTAIGGLLPMMFDGARSISSPRMSLSAARTPPTWVQLSTAIVFGLAFSKMITMGLTPAMLALPYRMRERGHGFRWVLGRIWAGITWPVRVLIRGARKGAGRILGVQPAE